MFNSFDMFVESLDLSNHPVRKAKKRIKTEYATALSYIVSYVSGRLVSNVNTQSYSAESDVQPTTVNHSCNFSTFSCYFNARLDLYYEALSVNKNDISTADPKALESVSACISRPWRKKHRLWLMCDVALILMNPDMIQEASQLIKGYLSKKQSEDLDRLVASLYDSEVDISKYINTEYLITQYRKNNSFLRISERRMIVTANMSAGKSTLINAIIGKPIAKTSQEVCTRNVCYIYSKPFEDGNVHLASPGLTLHANAKDFSGYEWDGEIASATFFSSITPQKQRICLIDTPGVNAALYRQHRDITHKALLKKDYEKVIYILSPTNLGTDAEMAHLKWVAAHVPKDHILFVLNKLDEYHSKGDNIQESIEGLRSDLVKIGFENPVICPISAYFALLLKMKSSGQQLSEDEQDEYSMMAKKFNREAYDLSVFYDDAECTSSDSEELRLSKKSGLFGFEKLLYGGVL